MIKFFRRIRQRLLTENKFNKYLIYAIGEIVLVVIGILIALQINNWNENRKANLAELRLFAQIIKDLEVDQLRIQDNINTFNEHQSVHYQILQEVKGTVVYDSSIPFYRLRQEVINDLIVADNHSDKSANIKDIQLRAMLEQYFRKEARVKHALNSFADYKKNHLRPFFSRKGIHNTEALFKIGGNEKKALFDNASSAYMKLLEQEIIDYSKLKAVYGTIELDQKIFDLGIKTYWALYTLEELSEANQILQKTLSHKLKKQPDRDPDMNRNE